VEQSLRQAVLWDEVKDILDKSAMNLSGGQQQAAVHRARFGDVNRIVLLIG
jgi:ABC-type phosphate transport system ATPase subunit